MDEIKRHFVKILKTSPINPDLIKQIQDQPDSPLNYACHNLSDEMPHGTPADVHALRTKHIDKELEQGKYTILQIVERDSDKDLEIILGQIKK